MFTKRTILLLVILGIAVTNLYSQDDGYRLPNKEREVLPVWALKTNILSTAFSATMNLGGELRLRNHLTADLSVSYNPWNFSASQKFKHILVRPELRYWLEESFSKHYLGTHLLYSNYNYSNYNIGGLNLFPNLKGSRYRGNAYGFGISYGYQWILSSRWNIEATLGLGYIYMDYTRYECKPCGEKLEDGSKHYFGPTRAGLSLVYIINN